ncbi:hypothetical protein HCN44_008901 [Aphidius gifuensis]|uniref:Muskelin N-terminal domain-containing protein n=1 Tax=Aphidius gifuensis TaxID=684658 RepID=A0A834XQG4_APHGI|nr:muskelin-like [Aphidius gifuensis]KAF7991530.1 hypothetical protein HCN44_008901 [Aphidius gifuensis]
MASVDDMSDCHCTLGYKMTIRSSDSSPCLPAENDLVDKPLDQSSRWSSENDNHPQYIVLKLDYPSIVKSIIFGKCPNKNVCLMKKFIIYGALEYDQWTKLLESTLKNDYAGESFELKHTIGCDDIYFPIRYIKIVPLEAWGPNFDISNYFFCVNGIYNKLCVDKCIDKVKNYLKDVKKPTDIMKKKKKLLPKKLPTNDSNSETPSEEILDDLNDKKPIIIEFSKSTIDNIEKKFTTSSGIHENESNYLEWKKENILLETCGFDDLQNLIKPVIRDE